ncbi:hypothetical protein PVAG01_07287 [Phlyctema vagabunda]|uniref:Uncharacterized protein n=1 Tax=Phlyctema vagabunda TaxID=108571 RepID=A0ABR4PC04_9HELO
MGVRTPISATSSSPPPPPSSSHLRYIRAISQKPAMTINPHEHGG